MDGGAIGVIITPQDYTLDRENEPSMWGEEVKSCGQTPENNTHIAGDCPELGGCRRSVSERMRIGSNPAEKTRVRLG